MLRSTTLFGLVGFSLLYLTSYSSGPTGRAGDVTGSPLTTTQCGNCHNGGNFDPTTTISLLDEGVAVMSYEPGKTYTLQVSVAAQNNPGGYGFQAVALDGANNNTGQFGAAPADFRVASAGGRSYLEHSGIQAESMVEIDWTAPAAGAGDVIVYAAGNAINRNGSSTGDNVDNATLTIAEGEPSSTSQVNVSAEFKVYQTSANELALSFNEQLAFPIQYTIQDITGKVMLVETATTTEVNATITTGASQMVVVVVREANGRTGAKQVALR